MGRKRGDVQDQLMWAELEGQDVSMESSDSHSIVVEGSGIRFGEVALGRHDDDWTPTTYDNDTTPRTRIDDHDLHDNTQRSRRSQRGRSP